MNQQGDKQRWSSNWSFSIGWSIGTAVPGFLTYDHHRTFIGLMWLTFTIAWIGWQQQTRRGV